MSQSGSASSVQRIQDATGEGSKKIENVNIFYDRSEGMLYVPCGYRMARYEMYMAESFSSVFFAFLTDLLSDTFMMVEKKNDIKTPVLLIFGHQIWSEASYHLI